MMRNQLRYDPRYIATARFVRESISNIGNSLGDCAVRIGKNAKELYQRTPDKLKIPIIIGLTAAVTTGVSYGVFSEDAPEPKRFSVSYLTNSERGGDGNEWYHDYVTGDELAELHKREARGELQDVRP